MLYEQSWSCSTSASSSYCISSSSPDRAIFTQDAGNLTFGISVLIFLNGLIFIGMVFTLFGGGRTK